jgi:hypothetical protein
MWTKPIFPFQIPLSRRGVILAFVVVCGVLAGLAGAA